MLLAASYIHLGQYEEALEGANRVLELDPQNEAWKEIREAIVKKLKENK